MNKKPFLLLMLLMTSALSYAVPLPGADAFKLSTKIIDPNTLLLEFKIHKGYFLYKNRIRVHAGKSISLGPLRFPPSLMKKNGKRKPYQVYRRKLLLPVSLLNSRPGEAELTVDYQGCSDSGFCYPPMQQAIMIKADKHLALVGVELEKATPKEMSKKTASNNEQDRFSAIFKSQNLWLIMISFYGFGLLLAFTPCVLPMVPVLSGMLVNQHKKINTGSAFLISLTYVLSMSLSYALAGVIVAALGKSVQAALQTPLTIGLFSLVFVLLALSMFGLYELKLPDAWQTKLTLIGRKKTNGAYLSAAIMGILSTLILSPCVTAPMVGALSFIANSGDVILGGLSLLFLGFGMGTPLLLIGTSLGRFLPNTGPWMNTIKAFFGIALLGVAVYLLSRILPGHIVMMLWAGLMIIPALFMGAFDSKVESHHARLFKALGLMLFTWGILVLIGGAMGNSNPLKPLQFQLSSENTPRNHPPYRLVTSINETQKAIRRANGKEIFIDFYADWCTACKLMESTVFEDDKVINALKKRVWLKADVTANDNNAIQLQRYYKVFAPPTFIILDGHGREKARIVGETDAKTLLKALTR